MVINGAIYRRGSLDNELTLLSDPRMVLPGAVEQPLENRETGTSKLKRKWQRLRGILSAVSTFQSVNGEEKFKERSLSDPELDNRTRKEDPCCYVADDVFKKKANTL